MTEAEIVAYLLRYLMEFGPEETTSEQRSRNEWYGSSEVMSIVHGKPLRLYRTVENPSGAMLVRLTPAAFDLLRRYHESNH